MAISQLERSTLRKALQSAFFDGVLTILNTSHRRGNLPTRLGAAWKWMLTLACLRRMGLPDDANAQQLRQAAIEYGIHPGTHPRHQHHELFEVWGIQAMSDEAIDKAYRTLSDYSLIHRTPKRRRVGTDCPWDHLLPEDIGSCFEVLREVDAINSDNEGIDLIQRGERRRKGVHHTPHDVVRHMADLSLGKLSVPDDGLPDDLVICDLAVGAGAFPLEFARILSNISGLGVGTVLQRHIIGFDIDSEVLLVAALCFHLEAGCPDAPHEFHLHQLDSIGLLNSKEKIKERIVDMMPSSKGVATITVGNPPYSRARKDDYDSLGFQSSASRNLSAYFLEQAIEVTEIGQVVCQIVPLSLIHSQQMRTIRDVLYSRCFDIDIEAYDCVPGYMFNQGKIGSNTSIAITQRVAIITASTGSKKSQRITSTRLIRWGSDERGTLFESIPRTLIPEIMSADSTIPLLGDENGKRNYTQAISTGIVLGDILSEGEFTLYVPNAVRYFITAVREEQGRNEMELRFKDEISRDLAQVLINGSFFYWYWRVVGGGFGVSMREVKALPMPSQALVNLYQDEIATMARELHEQREVYAVTKSNKGTIHNVKYGREIIFRLDEIVEKLYNFPVKGYPYSSAKSKSLKEFKSFFNAN